MSPARPTAGTPYAQAHDTGRRSVRKLILDTASALLEADGPEALTMRRIANDAGCSTTVLYTMFGGKAGIADALWCEGFERLRVAIDQATGDDPLDRLIAIGRAYRANALANRSYYAIMFQRPIPGFEPSPQAREASVRPLRSLTGAVDECVAAGVFRPGDTAHMARVLWAAVHGAVSLELAGYEGARDPDALFRDIASAAASWFMTSTGRNEASKSQRDSL